MMENLPEEVYTVEHVRALDAGFTRDHGVTGLQLMQRAARAAYQEMGRYWTMASGRLLVLCGVGNNGGDGAFLALEAMRDGWEVTLATLLPTSKARGDAARAFQEFAEAGGKVREFTDEPIAADLVVDALFGTGLNREVTGPAAQAVTRINEAAEQGAGVLALDIASGIDANTGAALGVAVQADLTVTFIGMKIGQLTNKGRLHCGQLILHTLEAPRGLYAQQPALGRRITALELSRCLQPRKGDAHKGDNGRVLCLGGYQGLGGAIRLTAEAALRTGAGLVSVGCHEDHAAAMSQARPELMCQGLTASLDEMDRYHLAGLLDKATVIALGPGLGTQEWGQLLWQQAKASGKPMILDADALNWLAREPQACRDCILTPHPGEAARLLDWTTRQVQADRPGAARELAQRYQTVVVLKGAGTLIADSNEIWVCTQGNPGMAVGGMGDLLTGVIAAFLAQGLSLFQAAACSVYVHALAGDQAADQDGERGLLPTDLLPFIRRLANPSKS